MNTFTVRAPDGTIIGQCNGSCYEADPTSRCDCVCGGENHGKGERHAVEHAWRLAEHWKQFEDVAAVELDDRARQTHWSM